MNTDQSGYKTRYVSFRSLMSTMVAIGFLIEAIQTKTYLTKPLSDVWMHVNDKMVIELDDYVSGDGTELKISSTSNNILIKNQLVHFRDLSTVEMPHKIFMPYSSPDEQILLYKHGMISKRLNDSVPETIVIGNALQLPAHTECVDMAFNEEIERVVVFCKYKENNVVNIVVVNIDISALKLTASISQPLQLVNYMQDRDLIFSMHNESVVIYQKSSSVSFMLLSVKSDAIEFKGAFSRQSDNFDAYFTEEENCELLDVLAELPNVYLSVNCSKTKKEYLAKCELVIKNKISEVKCPTETHIISSSFYHSRGYFFKRLEPYYRDSDILFYFRYNDLSLVSFKQNTKRSIFNFTDIDLDKPGMIIMRIETFIKYMYIVVKDTESQSISLLTASFYRGYYRREELVKGKEQIEQNFDIQLLPENLSKSVLAYLVEFKKQSDNHIRGKVYEDNILSMEIILEEPGDKQVSINGLGHGDEPQNSLISVPVWVNLSSNCEYQLSQIYNFSVNILTDFEDSAELGIASEYTFFKGTKLPVHMPFSKQSFQGWSPSVDAKSDAWTIDSKYILDLDLKYENKSNLPPGSKKNYHIEDEVFVYAFNNGMLIYSIEVSLGNKTAEIKEWQIIKDVEGLKFLEGTLHNGIVYISVNTGNSSQTFRLYKIEKGKTPIFTDVAIDVSVAAMTVYKDRLVVDMYWKGEIGKRAGLYNCKLDVDSDLSEFSKENLVRYEYFPSDQEPFRITWPFRNIPFLHIATRNNGYMYVHEIAFEYYRELEVPISTYHLGKLDGDVYTCSFSKHLLIVGFEKTEIYSLDREYHLINKTKYFPVKEYNVERIISRHCDHNNPYLAILVATRDSKYLKVIVYRVEESGDHTLRRVCLVKETIIPKDEAGLAVQVKIHTVNKDNFGYVTLFWSINDNNGAFLDIFTFRLSGHEITITDLAGKYEDTLSFSLQVYRKPFSSQPLLGSTRVKFIDQDYGLRSEPESRLSKIEDGYYNIEEYYKFDGFFLSSRLENSKGKIDSKDGKMFRDRSTDFQANTLSSNSVLRKFIIEKNVIFAWNSNGKTAHIFQDSRELLRLEDITVKNAHFASDDNMFDINNNQYIVAHARVKNSKESTLHFFWRDSSASWRHLELEIEKGIKEAKAVKVGKYMFAYAGLDINMNSVTVGYFSFNPDTSSLIKVQQSKVNYITDSLDQSNCYGAGDKLILILKKKFNEVGSIYQFSFNKLFDRVEIDRKLEIVLFPGITNHYISKNLYCTSTFDDTISEAVCFMHNPGIYYHANNITLRMPKVKRNENKPISEPPTVSKLNSFKAIQGFTVIGTSSSMKYVVQLVQKTGESKINHDYLIVVYKIDAYQSSPFLILHKDSFGDNNQINNISSARVGLYSPEHGHHRVAIMTAVDNKSVLYTFRISQMTINLKKGQDEIWGTKDNLVVEYIGENGEVKHKMFNLYSIFGPSSSHSSPLVIWLFWIVGLLIIIILTSAIVFLITYCTGNKDVNIEGNGEITYYKNPQREKMEREKSKIDSYHDEDLLCTTLMDPRALQGSLPGQTK